MPDHVKLKYHSVALFVADIEASKKFYSGLLELPVALDFGRNVILDGGVTLWEIDPSHVILKTLGTDAVGDRSSQRFEMYFETGDIDAAEERMNAAGVEFLHGIHEEPWGQKTLRIFDPDRHLVEIGESMETFVRRLHRDGLTPEQVSGKTSVPVGHVRKILGL